MVTEDLAHKLPFRSKPIRHMFFYVACSRVMGEVVQVSIESIVTFYCRTITGKVKHNVHKCKGSLSNLRSQK